MGFLFAGGALILYVLSLFIKKKQQENQNPLTSSNSSPSNQGKINLSYDKIYNWIRAQEGIPSRTAKKDGKLKDGTQLFSIGLGHQIQPNESYLLSATLTDEEILDIFKKDVQKITSSMNKVIDAFLNDNQALALFSLRYNIGENAFNESTLLKLVNQNKFNEAAEQFAVWRLSEGKINQGLVLRRQREKVLFNTPT